MASSNELPRFFTVYLSQYSSNTLLIPSCYYEHLPRRLPKTVILMGTSGRSWRVAMVSKGHQVYFEQGWSSFVADHELKDGEFLTFVFDGHKTYEVSIFGHDSCKEFRAEVEIEEISDDDTESDNSHHTFDTPPITLSDDTESDIVSYVEAEVVSSKTKINMNMIAYLDDPKNIYLVTSLKKRKYELLIRAQFMKDYDLKFGNYVEYIDNDHGNITAEVIYSSNHTLVKKWHIICRRNKVKKEDSIVCEMLRNGDKVVYAIRVHVVRGGEASNT